MTIKLLETVSAELLTYLRYCMDYSDEQQTYYRQAFAVIQFAMRYDPTLEQDLIEMWDAWVKSFEKVYELTH